jgi:formamidopyrimidine-DNA glycosylase
MPELPEVEVTRLSFADRIAGARVLAVQMGKPLRWPLGVEASALVGEQVQQVSRRGKYLWLQLTEGGLLMHLGMSGSLRFAPQLPAAGAHDHFDLVTDLGTLRLHDPRRFGAVVYSTSMDSDPARKLLAGLGVEPLTDAFEVESFYQALQQRKAAIKQVLLAGDIVVGVGNIYASEALFKAGIRPTLAANRVSRPRVRRLHAAIVQVLQQALAVGGSSLRDFVNAEGQTGYFQLQTQVYGRAGQPCRVCLTPIKVVQQGQRSTFYCPACQKR